LEEMVQSDYLVDMGSDDGDVVVAVVVVAAVEVVLPVVVVVVLGAHHCSFDWLAVVVVLEASMHVLNSVGHHKVAFVQVLEEVGLDHPTHYASLEAFHLVR